VTDPFSLTLIVGMLGLLIVAVIWLVVLVTRISSQLHTMQLILNMRNNGPKQQAMKPEDEPKERFFGAGNFGRQGVIDSDSLSQGPIIDPRKNQPRKS